MKSTLKAFLILIAISLIIAPLASVSESVIPLIIVAVLVIFPGQDRGKPRLVRAMPFLWGLSLIEAIIFCIDHFFSLHMFPPELYAMVHIEDSLLALAATPALLWSYLKGRPSFKGILIASTLASVGFSLNVFFSSLYMPKDILDAVASVALDITLAVYMLYYSTRPPKGTA